MKFEDAMVKMRELSLLQFSHCNENEITVSLHSMLSEWLRMRLDKSSQSTYLTTSISNLKAYLESIRHSDHKTRQEGQAHLDTLWRGLEGFSLGGHFLEARITFGNFYADQRRHKDAKMMYNPALAGYEEAQGPEHTSALTTVHTLGILYADQGRPDDAETSDVQPCAGW